jgi:uncharacterized protein YaaQ
MKLLMAVVNKDDAGGVSSALTRSGFTVTKLSTTGGFLTAGNTTFMIGTEDDKVDEAISIISVHSKKRTQLAYTNDMYPAETYDASPTEITVGGATVFVLGVERFEKV